MPGNEAETLAKSFNDLLKYDGQLLCDCQIAVGLVVFIGGKCVCESIGGFGEEVERLCGYLRKFGVDS